VTRVRLREAYSPEKLAEIYPAPHQHSKWPDHQVRVAVTVQIAHALVGRIQTAADLSCGDAAILAALGVPVRYLGDLAAGYPYQGPIERTVEEIPQVELFVCSETLEHLDDPDTVLKQIRAKTDALVASTPVEAWGDAQRNPEHYHAWDRAAVEEMLTAAGFRVVLYNELDLRPGGGEYCFGIFGCR
jgi:hypothetical protein